jgi:hypothetical protein
VFVFLGDGREAGQEIPASCNGKYPGKIIPCPALL